MMKFLPKLLLLVLLAFPATLLIKGKSVTAQDTKKSAAIWGGKEVLAVELSSCCGERGRPLSVKRAG